MGLKAVLLMHTSLVFPRPHTCTRAPFSFSNRWMAPEALVQQESSVYSDVWSYGVLVWEVWSFCEVKPYSRIPTAASLLHRLAYGERLEQPPGYVFLSFFLFFLLLLPALFVVLLARNDPDMCEAPSLRVRLR